MIQKELAEVKKEVYGENGSDLGLNFHNFDKRIDALDARITSLEMESKKESNTAAVYTRTDSCDCSEKIASLENKVAALENFVKALQEESYLTLAKIKQAAADNCPICNHEQHATE
jgi:polyhydroxyalkanoate synthesis regulator phasin